jgi:uncharacterized protein
MNQSKPVTLTAIFHYPVKSMRGIQQTEILCHGEGVVGDRRWMVIDSSGQFITQRHLPQLAKISVSLCEKSIKLKHCDFDEILVLPLEPSNEYLAENVTIWNDNLANIQGYPASQAWLNTTIGAFRGKSLTLVKMPAISQREVEPELVGTNRAYTGFADAYPFLITNQNSLNKLNEKLLKLDATKIDMRRFRPNIVISGLEPFEEERGGRLQFANGAEFELVKPCQRCQMITQDQDTGKVIEVGQPTKALMQAQSIDPASGAYFGQNAILNVENIDRSIDKVYLENIQSDSKELAQKQTLLLKVGQKLTWIPNL